MFLTGLSYLVRELQHLKMFFNALGRCPGQALIEQREIDSLLLGSFQSRRQFLASFHGGILTPPEEKQKDGVGELTGKLCP
jgi:hypothetical protein